MELTPRTVHPQDMQIVHRTADNPVFNPGRRAEIKYQDLGLFEATRGEIRAEIMRIKGTSSKPTGWHYHTADAQFLYMLNGWVKIEFSGRGVVTLEAGDSITIPAGVVHQELCSSDEMDLIEISLPGKLGTVNVEAPIDAVLNASDFSDEISVVKKVGHAEGT